MNIREFTKKWGTEGWHLPVQRYMNNPLGCDEALSNIIGEIFGDLQSALESENNTRAETFAECAEYCENIAPGLHDIAESAYKSAGEHFRSEEKKCR